MSRIGEHPFRVQFRVRHAEPSCRPRFSSHNRAAPTEPDDMRAVMRVASVSRMKMAYKWFASNRRNVPGHLVTVFRYLASASVISITSICSKSEARLTPANKPEDSVAPCWPPQRWGAAHGFGRFAETYYLLPPPLLLLAQRNQIAH